MAVGNISTYGLFQSTVRDVTSTITRLAGLQDQISSGQKSSDFAGIAERSAEFLNVETLVRRADQFITNNNITLSKLQSTNIGITQVIDASNELKTLVSTRRTGIANIDFNLLLDAQWKRVAGALNTTSNGQYIFSGTATDVAPVDPDTYPELTSDGALDTEYYLGSSQDIRTRSQEGVEFVSSVRANDPAFQKIVEGFALAKQGNIDDNDDTLRRAYDLIDTGIKEVISAQATVNSNKVRLEETNRILESSKLYWKNTGAQIGDTDLLAASTQLAIDQGILQASFQSFARITSLKLSDFLR